jgi:iron complex transport system substrate-binding protein
MNKLRLISFLPAATEMVYALGLGDRLVGVSHECDFPAAAKTKPVVVKAALPLETMTLREIDVTIAQRIGSGQSLYEVDERLLTQLAPTHILTQELCHVCAPSGNEITRVLAALRVRPEIIWFTPHSIEEIFGNLRDLGAATGTSAKAEEIITVARARLQKVAALAEKATRRPRVFCLEWIDPYYCCGHWVPKMVELAGGNDALGRKGKDSVRIPWAEIVEWAPEVLIVSPCGFNTEKAVAQAEQLLQQPGWSDLPAVRNGRVFAVDANAYFARPGPRVVEGVELLAHLIHPEIFEWNGPPEAFQKVTPPKKSRGPSAAKREPAHAFTLIELLIVIAIIAILSAMLLPVLNKGKLSAQCGVCQSNQRELGLATQMYWSDNAGNSFEYQLGATNNGVLYWFGWIANGSEGHRAFDLSQGALFPYMNGNDVRLCPSPVWGLPQFEPKGTNVIFSYGCNSLVFGGPGHSVINATKILHPADTAIFADAAEVNNFQAPASKTNPLFEEWYYEDLETNYSNPDNYPNAQFRHSQKANVAFADGHVEMERFVPGSIDPRLPSLLIGQLPPQLLIP